MLPFIGPVTSSRNKRRHSITGQPFVATKTCCHCNNDVTNKNVVVESKAFGEMENRIKKKYAEILKVGDDMFLSDRTVAPDDPRVINSFNAMTRLRRRTGFDSTLMRDRTWANKTAKDLKTGLAKLDKIEIEKQRHEIEKTRDIDAARWSLEQRLNRMKRTRSVTGLKGRTRSKSDSCCCECGNLAFSQYSLRESCHKLNEYISNLEAQGGFFGNTGRPKVAFPEINESGANQEKLVGDTFRELLPDIHQRDSDFIMFAANNTEMSILNSKNSKLGTSKRRWSDIGNQRRKSLNFVEKSSKNNEEIDRYSSGRTFIRSSFSAPKDLNMLDIKISPIDDFGI